MCALQKIIATGTAVAALTISIASQTIRFDTVAPELQAPLAAYFMKHLDDQARAEDLAQETLIAILKKLGRNQAVGPFESYDGLRAYALTVAANVCRNERKRLARAPRPVELSIEVPLPEPDVFRAVLEEKLETVYVFMRPQYAQVLRACLAGEGYQYPAWLRCRAKKQAETVAHELFF